MDSKINKFTKGLLYLIGHPMRAIRIIKTYKHLRGRYRMITIMSHAYLESVYEQKHKKSGLGKIEDNNHKFILYKADGFVHSGGLTDRLKGICTLYMYAKQRQKQFYLSFTHPFNITEYLLPNDYDWVISQEKISYNLKTTAIYTYEHNKDMEKFMKSNSDKIQIHVGCNSRECFKDFSLIFKELFKPSPFLEMQIKSQKENLGSEYISISFRFQNLLGEFTEAKSKPIEKMQQNELINKCIHAIDDIKQRHINIPQILITSDSNKFREIAIHTYTYTYTYIIDHEVGHIDYSDNSKELTAFLDFFLIAGAKKAYQVRTIEMYNSDFPVFAAKSNNVPYEMILI